MTIPIIPGPFSFVQGAGEAVGAIASARKEEHDKQVREAQTRISNLLQLIGQGRYDPSVLASPMAAKDFATAGLPAPSTTPSFEDRLREIKARALMTLQPGGAAEAAVSGVPREAVAGAAERTTIAGATTAEGQATITGEEARAAASKANAAIAMSDTQSAVYQGALKLLGDPTHPEIQMLAQEAALGVLPYRIQQLTQHRADLSLQRQQMADNTRILMDALNDVNQIYVKSLDAYNAQLRQDAFTAGIDPADAQKFAAWKDAYVQTNPPPSHEQIADQYLQTNLGMTRAEFQRRIKAGLTGGDANAPAVPSTESPGKKVGAAPGETINTPAASGKISKAISHIGLNRNPDTADTTMKQFADAVRNGAYTDLEVKVIFSELRKRLPPDEYDNLKKLYNVYATEKVK